MNTSQNNPPHDSPQRIANVNRIGTIIAVDYERARARVKSGGIETDWLRWTTERNGLVRTWNPPTVGEEVELVALDGSTESAYIGQSFYNDAFPAPSHDGNLVVVEFSDGTRIEHNRATGTRSVTGLGTLNETIGETNTTTTTTHTGSTLHKGDVVNVGELTQSGASAFASSVAVTGGLSQGGVGVGKDHTHPQNDGNDNGGGATTGGVTP